MRRSPVSDILHEIEKDKERINTYQDKITKLKRQINCKKKLLWDICVHKWYIDSSEPFDSNGKKKCSYCQLCANPNYN